MAWKPDPHNLKHNRHENCHRCTTLSQTHHTVTDVPHCHRRTTLSQTHHTVTDAPHCHRRTTLSLSHSLPVYLLTVSAGVATGIPAFREAWRARYAASADVCEGRARGAHTVAQPGLRPRSCGLALSRHNRSPLFPVRPDRICRKYSFPRTIYFRNIRSASEIFGPPRSPTDERPRL